MRPGKAADIERRLQHPRPLPRRGPPGVPWRPLSCGSRVRRKRRRRTVVLPSDRSSGTSGGATGGRHRV